MSNKLCSEGQYQSPIDIKSNSVIQCATKCNLIFYYRTSKCSIVNIGNDIKTRFDNEPKNVNIGNDLKIKYDNEPKNVNIGNDLKTHYNNEPKNKTIYISDLSREKCMTWNDNNWHLISLQKAITMDWLCFNRIPTKHCFTISKYLVSEHGSVLG